MRQDSPNSRELDTVKLLSAKTAYKAAIEVAKSTEEINEHAIDLLA